MTTPCGWRSNMPSMSGRDVSQPAGRGGDLDADGGSSASAYRTDGRPACRSDRASPGRRPRERRDGSGHSTLQHHGRTPQVSTPSSRPVFRASCTRWPTSTQRRPGSEAADGNRCRGHWRGTGRCRRAACCGAAAQQRTGQPHVTGNSPPASTGAARRRRHQPVDHQRGGSRRRASAPSSGRCDHRRHRHGDRR